MEEAIQTRIDEMKSLNEKERTLIHSLNENDFNTIFEKRISAKEVIRFLNADHKAIENSISEDLDTKGVAYRSKENR